jgi:hypothetical protein
MAQRSRGAGIAATSYDRFAGACAIAAGIGAILFSVIFIVIVYEAPSWVVGLWFALLLLGALLTIAVFVALYERLREVDAGFALLGLLLGVAGAFGGIFHGGQNLAEAVKPSGAAQLTSLDPRGILRYAAAGLAMLAVSWLILAGRRLPRGLGYLGAVGGVLLIIIYLGRLTLWINPGDKLTLVFPVLFGLVVYPAWLFWVGAELWRRPVALRVPGLDPVGSK